MRKVALLLIASACLVLTSCSIEDTNILPNEQKNSELDVALKRVVINYIDNASTEEKELLKEEFNIHKIINQGDNTELWLLKPTYELAIIEEIIAMNSAVNNVSIDDEISNFATHRGEEVEDEDDDSTGGGKDNGDDTSDEEERDDSTGGGKDNGDDTSDEEERNVNI